MARIDGDLNVTGNISAANYPPPDSGSVAAETYTWEITDENEGQKSYFINHHFSTRFLEVHVFDVNGAKEVYPGITYPETGRICVWFSVAPIVGQVFRIVIVEIDSEDLETS